jgi:hypothetical protein
MAMFFSYSCIGLYDYFSPNLLITSFQPKCLALILLFK